MSKTMEPDKSLIVINKSEAEKVKIIVENVVKMLSSRIYIDSDGNAKNLISQPNEKTSVSKGDNVFTIKADNGDKYAVKVIFQKITTTGKSSVISEFLKDYVDYRKILVVKDFIGKIQKYVIKHNTQIFREDDFLEDIASYYEQPQFILMSPKEMKLVKLEYNVNDYTLKKMQKTDPIARYYALKRGEVVRIIRPSETSGSSVDYRIVS